MIHKPDVIISFLARVNVAVALSSIGVKTKLFVSERTWPPFASLHSRLLWFYKLLFKRADSIIVQTEKSKVWLQNRRFGHNSMVIPNPVVYPVPAGNVSTAQPTTVIAEGKEVKQFNGEDYILEEGIFADLSIVKAWKADTTGNLVFRKTARNFNPPAAMCGKICVVEVEEIVEPGQLDPDSIHLPGVYVHRIITGAHEKRIEQRTTRKREDA